MKIKNSNLKKKCLIYKTPVIQKINIAQTKGGQTLMMNESNMHTNIIS